MNLACFQACVAGYSDRLFDYQLLAVHAGYWSGYYTGARKPKSLASVLDKLWREHLKSRNSKGKKRRRATDVDVEAFKRMEQQFQQKLAQQRK